MEHNMESNVVGGIIGIAVSSTEQENQDNVLEQENVREHAKVGEQEKVVEPEIMEIQQNLINEDMEPQRPSILHMFIPEHWEQILPHLGCSDFHALIASSELIRNGEEVKKHVTTMLLPLILPTLLRQHGGITFRDIPTLCELNPGTKLAINAFLNAQYSPQRYWEMKTSCIYSKWSVLRNNLIECCEQTASVNVDRLFMTVKQDQPFLGKSLKVNFTHYRPEAGLAIFEPLLIYLREHGHHVKVLKCKHLWYMSGTFLLLPLLPKLRIIKLSTMALVLDAFEYVNLDNYPLLPDLETMDVSHSDFVYIITEFVQHYGPQFKTLICNDTFFDEWELQGHSYTDRLQNLEKVRVVVDGHYENVVKVLKENVLPKIMEIFLSKSNWKMGHISIRDIHDIVNRFTSTLTSLYVNMDIVEGIEDVVGNQGNTVLLTNLARFGTLISNINYSWVWKFIQLKCVHLLELRFEYDEGMDCPFSMEELNVKFQEIAFSMLPKLKRIRIIHHDPVYLPTPQQAPDILDITRNAKEWKKFDINET